VKAIVVDDESTSAPMAADAVGTFDDVYRREQPELVRLAAAMAAEVYAVVHEVVFTGLTGPVSGSRCDPTTHRSPRPAIGSARPC
jgi:hypothetical protein